MNDQAKALMRWVLALGGERCGRSYYSQDHAPVSGTSVPVAGAYCAQGGRTANGRNAPLEAPLVFACTLPY
jgi:hypothetical protein